MPSAAAGTGGGDNCFGATFHLRIMKCPEGKPLWFGCYVIVCGGATLGDWMATGLLAGGWPCSRACSTTTEGGGGAAASILEAEVGVESGGGCVVIRMTMASIEGRRRNSSPGGGANSYDVRNIPGDIS